MELTILLLIALWIVDCIEILFSKVSCVFVCVFVSPQQSGFSLRDMIVAREVDASGFAKTFPNIPSVSQTLGGPSLRLGIPTERLSIPPGIG